MTQTKSVGGMIDKTSTQVQVDDTKSQVNTINSDERDEYDVALDAFTTWSSERHQLAEDPRWNDVTFSEYQEIVGEMRSKVASQQEVVQSDEKLNAGAITKMLSISEIEPNQFTQILLRKRAESAEHDQTKYRRDAIKIAVEELGVNKEVLTPTEQRFEKRIEVYSDYITQRIQDTGEILKTQPKQAMQITNHDFTLHSVFQKSVSSGATESFEVAPLTEIKLGTDVQSWRWGVTDVLKAPFTLLYKTFVSISDGWGRFDESSTYMSPQVDPRRSPLLSAWIAEAEKAGLELHFGIESKTAHRQSTIDLERKEYYLKINLKHRLSD
jgi:hypothetical protein